MPQHPLGTRFYVPGYGHCYAVDIGSWIKDGIVDVWLPGTQADGGASSSAPSSWSDGHPAGIRPSPV